MTQRETLTSAFNALRQATLTLEQVVREALYNAEQPIREGNVRTDEEARAYCEEHGIPYDFQPGRSTAIAYEVFGVDFRAASHALALDAYLAALPADGSPPRDSCPCCGTELVGGPMICMECGAGPKADEDFDPFGADDACVRCGGSGVLQTVTTNTTVEECPDCGGEKQEPLPQEPGECAEWCRRWGLGMAFCDAGGLASDTGKSRVYWANNSARGDTPAEAVAEYVRLYGVPPVIGEGND